MLGACRLLLLVAVALTVGCGSSTPKRPPGMPPTPSTVSRKEPGGDAHDPNRAALERLAGQPWGWRQDRNKVFSYPLSDSKNWRRVRYWGVKTFVGFRYGDKHHGVAALWAKRLEPGEPETAELCLRKFEDWAAPIAHFYSTSFEDRGTQRATWEGKDVIVKKVDANVKSLLAWRRYLGVMGASLAWPRVCVVYGYAFRVDDAEDVASAVRDRYAREAFGKLTVIANEPPPTIE